MLNPPSGSWVGVLVSSHGSFSRGVFWRLLFFGGVATLVSWINSRGHQAIRLPVGIYEVSGAVIALVLAFRTNTAYNRFWEGRILWGGVVNACRNLQRALTYHAHLSAEESREVSTWIVIFAHSMRRFLRTEKEIPEVERLLPADEFKTYQAAPRRELYAAEQISARIAKLVDDQRLNPMMQRHTEALLASLIDFLGGCERILKTPTPFGYVLLIERCVFFYISTLPFAIVGELGWLCVPVTMMAAYLVLMIEGLGRELDEPFGHDPNDLALSRICVTIETNLLGSSPESILWPKPLPFDN